jgi:hypothetical protein
LEDIPNIEGVGGDSVGYLGAEKVIGMLLHLKLIGKYID